MGDDNLHDLGTSSTFFFVAADADRTNGAAASIAPAPISASLAPYFRARNRLAARLARRTNARKPSHWRVLAISGQMTRLTRLEGFPSPFA
jgi:hypothetical protein